MNTHFRNRSSIYLAIASLVILSIPACSAQTEPCDAGYGGAPVGQTYDAGPLCAALYCGEGEAALICGEDAHCLPPASGCTPARGPQTDGHGTFDPPTIFNATAYCCPLPPPSC